MQSIIRCQAKAAVTEVLEFISECHTVPAYKEVSLKVFNSWVTFELPVQESAVLVGKYTESFHFSSYALYYILVPGRITTSFLLLRLSR